MKNRILTMVCFLMGFALCSYPLVSSVVERRFQEKTVATYQKKVSKKDSQSVLEEARAYNSMLNQTKGAIIGNLEEHILSDESYLRQLNLSGDGVMGSVEIPKINVHLPIYHGTSDEVLAKGAGHLQESSLPVGGMNTRSVLTSHRGLPSSKLFTRLDELEQEDLFFINVCGEMLAYQVSEIKVIRPEDVEHLRILPEKDLVSLVTCTPYGINTHRLVVTGERVAYREKEYQNINEKPLSPREMLFTALPVLFLGTMVGIHLKNRKRCKIRNVRI